MAPLCLSSTVASLRVRYSSVHCDVRQASLVPGTCPSLLLQYSVRTSTVRRTTVVRTYFGVVVLWRVEALLPCVVVPYYHVGQRGSGAQQASRSQLREDKTSKQFSELDPA